MLTIPHYPRATENRLHGNNPSVQPSRYAFLKAAFTNFAILQILFLGLFSYIFGSLFQQGSHVHNMNVLFVDYDGGVIGESIRDAYQTLKGDGFPTLQEKSPSQFPTPGEIESDVCNIKYWGAIYTVAGASDRLAAALSGGEAATSYNRADVLSYVWNEARYSAIVDSTISGNLNTLSSAARVAYGARNGTKAMSLLSSNNESFATSLSIFTQPWTLKSINIQPTTQGSRLIYNTLVIILILIQEFFYLGTINGLYIQFKIYARLFPRRIIIYRNMISLLYTMIGSLCVAGAIWAFRASWQVNGNQFVLTWLILWLFAHANFVCLDVFTVWLPPPFVPMALITWVVFNVTSILLPFELSPAFYRWAYVMPAHEVYQVLVDIWSRGCNPTLHYSLPVLFALEVVGLLLSALGVYRRCHYATIAEEMAENAFQARLDTAMEYERKRDQERAEDREAEEELKLGGGEEDTEADAVRRVETQIAADRRDREELADVIQREESENRREKAKNEKGCSFGPSFGLVAD